MSLAKKSRAILFEEFIARNYRGCDPALLENLKDISIENLINSQKERELLLNFCLLTTHFFDVKNKSSFNANHLNKHLQKIASTLGLDYLAFYEKKSKTKLAMKVFFQDGEVNNKALENIKVSFTWQEWLANKDNKQFSILNKNALLDKTTAIEKTNSKPIAKLSQKINKEEHRDEIIVKKKTIGAIAWCKKDASIQFNVIFKTLLKNIITFSLSK